MQKIAQNRSMVFILTDPTLPAIQSAVSTHLFSICRKHLTLIMGIEDDRMLLAKAVMKLDKKKLSLKDVSAIMTNVERERQLSLFTKTINSWGGSVLFAPTAHWLSLAKKAYVHMRHSTMV